MYECYIGLIPAGFLAALRPAELLFRLLQHRNHWIDSLGKRWVLSHAVLVLAQQEVDLVSALDALFALLDGGQ